MSERDGPRGPRMLVLGLPYFGEMLAGQLRARGWQAEFASHPGRNPFGWAAVIVKLLRCRALYLIGSRADRRSPQAMLLKIWRKPVVIHWVGTDVQIAAEEAARTPIARSVVERPTHWCDAPWLVDEIAELGMRGEYVSLPIVGLTTEAPPLPAQFTVLMYLPVDAFDREVFDLETMLRLPREFPDSRFVLIPSPPETLPTPLPLNLEARGWVADMDALYREVTVMVRLTSHDGTSFMALESLSRGRYVIWTFPLTGAIEAAGYEAVSAALRDLHARHAAGALGLNEDGMEFARAHFAPETAIKEIDRRLRALLRAAR